MDNGVLFSKVRKGTNVSKSFLEFLEELETAIQLNFFSFDRKGEEQFLNFKKRLVFIFDNAKIH